MDHIEILELPEVPNVHYLRDKSGKGWYCSGDVTSTSNYASVCVSEEEILHDRSC